MKKVYFTDGNGAFASAKVGFSLRHAGKVMFKKLKTLPHLGSSTSILDLSRPLDASFTMYGNILGGRVTYPTFVQDKKNIEIRTVRYSRQEILREAAEALGISPPAVLSGNNYSAVLPTVTL